MILVCCFFGRQSDDQMKRTKSHEITLGSRAPGSKSLDYPARPLETEAFDIRA